MRRRCRATTCCRGTRWCEWVVVLSSQQQGELRGMLLGMWRGVGSGCSCVALALACRCAALAVLRDACFAHLRSSSSGIGWEGSCGCCVDISSRYAAAQCVGRLGVHYHCGEVCTSVIASVTLYALLDVVDHSVVPEPTVAAAFSYCNLCSILYSSCYSSNTAAPCGG